MEGVLVVDKPAGPTSHDVVDRVRRVLGLRRVGHTGTLDSFATGVLPVCVGKATRLARFLSEGEKVYRATVRLGFATTTDDLLGERLGPVEPAGMAPMLVRVDPVAVLEACRELTGDRMQLPPFYSARRVAGRRLYTLARQGVAVERTPARVTVHALDVLGVEADRVQIEVRCSPGTYVRAIARDLGEILGVGGHLVALRRTRSGEFGLEWAVGTDALTPALARETLIPLSRILTALPAVRLGPEGLEALRHGRDLGRRLVASGFPEALGARGRPEGRFRVLDEVGTLVGLAVPRGFGAPAPGLTLDPVLHPDVVLVE